MGAWYIWFPLILIFLVLLLTKKKARKTVAMKIQQRNKEKKLMQELAKRFIGKDCYINMLDGTVDGTLIEVTDGGIVVEKDGKQQIANLNYVMKIREYPHNQKGKRSFAIGD